MLILINFISFIYVIIFISYVDDYIRDDGMLTGKFHIGFLRDYISFPRTTESCAHCGRLGLKDELL